MKPAPLIFNQPYDTHLVIPPEDAGAFMDILTRALVLKKCWGDAIYKDGFKLAPTTEGYAITNVYPEIFEDVLKSDMLEVPLETVANARKHRERENAKRIANESGEGN